MCSPDDFSGCVIDEVDVLGNKALSDSDITDKIATAETGGFLEAVPIVGAVDALTVEYERFDRFVLERDLARVARIYRSKGYYQAIVRAGRVRRIDGHDDPKDVETSRLLVEIIVEEGTPVRIVDVDRDVNIGWKGGAPSAESDAPAAAAAQDAKSKLSSGEVFTEERYLATRDAIQTALRDRGYAYASVEPTADVDVVSSSVKVTYTVDLGPKCRFGRVQISGLGPIPEWQVRPALEITPGEPYSQEKIEKTKRILTNMGVFGSVVIEPETTRTGPRVTDIPILIRVQPASLGSVRLGGGFEVGDQVAVRGVAGWQHKNATGALDRFNVEARPRLVAYPWRLSTLFGSEPFAVPEIVLRVSYALPMPFDPPTSLFVQSQGSIALERNTDPPPELTETTDIQGEYLLEHRQGIQRTFWDARVLLSLSHNLSISSPFSYNLDETTSSGQSLLISFLQLFASLDLRENADGKPDSLRPERGIFAALNLELAGYFLSGDADDVKLMPEFRFYAPLGRRVVLAGRLAFGLLFSEYGLVLDAPIPIEDVLEGSGTEERRLVINRDVEVLEKRGLFSGGPSSNRGYGWNEIAPHRVVSDAGERLAFADAIGGRTRWELSVELRFPIVGDLGGTVFIDTSDVTAGFAELRADHPHLSTGAGIAYFTPVGPLRIDLGVRVPYLQAGGEDVRQSCAAQTPELPAGSCTEYISDQGDPAELFGLPMALSISIGNTY